MVDGRVVLVDRLLHETKTQYACVEVDVSRRVSGDPGDVVDTFELHRTWVLTVPESPAAVLGRRHARPTAEVRLERSSFVGCVLAGMGRAVRKSDV